MKTTERESTLEIAKITEETNESKEGITQVSIEMTQRSTLHTGEKSSNESKTRTKEVGEEQTLAPPTKAINRTVKASFIQFAFHQTKLFFINFNSSFHRL